MGMMGTHILKRIIDRVMKHNGKGLPPPRFSDGDFSEYSVEMRDGVRLKTFVHFPKEEGQFPVIFVRNPYCYEFDAYRYVFQNLVKYGFILCFQNVRGRGGSEGEFVPFENERNDGIDTVSWIKAQDWYSNNIVPMGVSYLAMSHLSYSDTWDGDFKTAVLSMYGGNLYGLAYENGMFRDEFFTVWSFQNNDFKTIDGDDAIGLYGMTEDVLPRTALMQTALGSKLGFYDNLISNPSRIAPVWDGLYFMPDTSKLKTPLCLITGWYDFTVRGMTELYSSLETDVRQNSAMLIGPWTHLMQNNGDVKTPRHYIGGFMGFKFALKWLLDFFYPDETDGSDNDKVSGKGNGDGSDNDTLNGKGNGDGAVNGSDKETGVKYYVINKGGYETEPDLPKFNESRFFFGYGWRLTKNRRIIGGIATYVYNPSNPFKTIGGGSAFPTLTPFTRRVAQCAAKLPDELRDDVMCFESPVLSGSRTVLGGKVELTVASCVPDTCFSVKLCTREKGKLYAFSYGITNIVNNLGQENPYEPGTKRKLIIDLSPVAFEVKKGSSIVLYVTSSDYPSFHRHLNQDGKWCEMTTPQKAVQTLFLDESELKLYFRK